MPTMTSASTSTLNVDRKRLLAALTRIGWAIPHRTNKPILTGVRLEAIDGILRLDGTDLDFSLMTRIPVDGELRACVVTCDDFLKRLKTSKAETCTLGFDRENDTLVVNGGRVEHRIHTMDAKEFPAIKTRPRGEQWRVSGQAFRSGLAVALKAVATEQTRYAINGVLLHVYNEESHLVATDGRRLVIIGLDPWEGSFKGKAILPRPAATLLGKLIGKNSTDPITVSVHRTNNSKNEENPAELFFAGADWLMSCREVEGNFPHYQDVIPKFHSRFVVDRCEFIDTLTAVASSTDIEHKSIRLNLSSDSVRLSAGGFEAGESSGQVAAEFIGGGDNQIITAFNPGFLLDAFKSISDDRVVIDVDQNHPDKLHNKVSGRPTLIYGQDSLVIRWVIMNVSLGLDASRETLGSNYTGDEIDTSVGSGTKSRPNTDSETDTSPESVPTETPSSSVSTNDPSVTGKSVPARRRRTVDHSWPEIGTRLDGVYQGETYAALVVAAPRLKSGKSLQLINGPALGRIFNSMTAAMLAATARQRQESDLGKKGLPGSGWDFWKQPKAKRKIA